MANVSVIIPSFNGLDLLQKHLPSVLTAMRHDDELIIVDDASHDDSIKYLTHIFQLKFRVEEHNHHTSIDIYDGRDLSGKNIIVRHQSQNLRFGQSCNLAAISAKHELLFLLNNDVSLTKDTINQLVSSFETLNQDEKEVFAIGCLEYEGLDENAPKAGKNVLYFDRGMFWHRKAKTFESGPTAWVSGGSGLFNKKLWLSLNGFDLHYYPAYWEDVDLSWRARKKGYLVYFDSKAQVFHQHESTHVSYFSSKTLTDLSLSHQRYFTFKNGDMWQKIAFCLWQPYWLIYHIYHKFKFNS